MFGDDRLPERFWGKVSVEPNTGCWLWTATCSGGYGRYSLAGEMKNAHRVAYQALVGPIPKTLHMDHLCRVRSCCNPEHLEPVSPGENIRRGDTGKLLADKTHCPQGHPYSGDNLFYDAGARKCRTCARARCRGYSPRRRKTEQGGVECPS